MLVRASLRTCAQVRRDALHSSSSSSIFKLKQLIATNPGQHRRQLSSSPVNANATSSNQTNLFRALSTHNPRNLAYKFFKSKHRINYADFTTDIVEYQKRLAQICSAKGIPSLKGERVAFAAFHDYGSVVTLFALLASDAIAVPVLPTLPHEEVRYIMENADAKMLLVHDPGEAFWGTSGWSRDSLKVEVMGFVRQFGHREVSIQVDFPDVHEAKGGVILYTSGTTSRPKGVFLPLTALQAQAQSLIEAWKYTPEDHLLHVLPLHHIHGLVNALIVPLLAGSAVEFMRAPSSPAAMWDRLISPFTSDKHHNGNRKITFLTGVPTMYTLLMAYIPGLHPNLQSLAKKAISPDNLRLNISGSAALPTPTKSAWTELSHGNVLLERYGMTEVGMALSCGLDPKDRVDGSVGWPLPSVEVRLWDTDKEEVIQPGEEIDAETGRERIGEIQLRGPTIFREYWNNPKATAESFVEDADGRGKWFRTGDVAVRRIVEGSGDGSSGEWAKGPMYFIQGRMSVDIIKTGGEKVSALEVERELLSLPEIAEAAVVGLPSTTWGQTVAAVIVLKDKTNQPEPNTTTQGSTGEESGDQKISSGRRTGYKPWNALRLHRALASRLARYKHPREVKVLKGPIPRNAMGKVNKKALVKEIFGVEG